VALDAALILRLYRGSSAGRWQVALEDFAAAIERSAARAAGSAEPAAADLERQLSALHLDDLALALACAAGVDAAWDHFLHEYRPALYRAAAAIDHTGGARDLADSLYADLFGLRERGGVRQSLFRYFHGRSSLATWLRAVLAQRYVDVVRAGRRVQPLPDDDDCAGAASTARSRRVADPDTADRAAWVRGALTAATRALPSRDRLRLSLYHVQQLTLAAIGRLLGEHEATVSRHLTRARREIRERVERTLRDAHGLDALAIEDAIRAVVDDPGPLDAAAMMGAAPGPEPRKIDAAGRSIT
jgi:RNA polymerase sigma-70 factor (ECF subfamily)